ncbi:MAG TPA: 2,3-bisphosphoglycerate-independent phosphoglycerate mutase [Methanomicrobiales archaeon]|nr:2,3-bisphosphoglycerate-independent phosphoglycerate mutase [Methanomicrobiales archaeon]
MTAGKVLLLVLDGISDRPCPELGGRTPLEAARTPNLDRMAREGICGIMDPIGPGIRPGSDTAHLAILGYPPERYYTGRGPLEAEGCGIHMEPGMIGFRANFATLGPDGRVTDRRAGRIHGTGPLCDAIEAGVRLKRGLRFSFRPGAGHRAAFALRGTGLGACVSSNDPKAEGLEPPAVAALTNEAKDRRTADACNDFLAQARAILADHPLNRGREKEGLPPANAILIRGAGEMGRFEPFADRYHLQGSVIAAATLITGIGRVVGLESVPVPDITGSADTNLDGKVRAAIGELGKRDFVLLNIKGADEAGHDGHPLEKRDFIARVDAALEPLLSLGDTVIAACGDHSTPCAIRDHSADPVPLVIHGEGVRVDGVIRFTETACAGGGLHRIPGSALMPILLDLVNRAKKYGA